MSDVVIIGGGIIGLTSAYLLAQENARVTVVDRQDFGQEASWAGAGIIPPGNTEHAASPFDRLRSLSAASFPGLSADLREQTGIDNGYRRSGGLEFVGEETSASPEEWRGAGIAVQELTEAQTREREPAVAPGLGHIFLLPDLAQVRNPRHIKALLAACAKLCVQLRPHCPVQEFLTEGGRLRGLRCGQETIYADAFVITAGAWTDSLLACLGLRLDIRPVRGQIVLLKPSAPLIRHVLLWGDRYLVPRADGRVLAGSTEEHVGFDKRTTDGACQDLLRLAYRLVPGLKKAEVERCWAGLRPGSPDGLPFIGPAPGYANLWVAAGHYRAGIQLSPGTAQLLMEMILRRPYSLDPRPFQLERKVVSG
jgi:glycine oxidase